MLHLGKQISSGTFGSVYEATKDNEDERYVIKILHKRDGDDVEAILYNEASIVLSLQHPNIIKCIGKYQENKLNGIIFEHAQTTLLTKLICKHVIHLEDILGLVKAVSYVHENNILHRDIKPSNILYKDNVLKLCDFGSARKIDECELNNYGWTSYITTRWYRAPELFLPFTKYYTTSIDIWRVGCVISEILRNGVPLLKSVNRDQHIVMMLSLLKKKERYKVLLKCHNTSTNSISFHESDYYNVYKDMEIKGDVMDMRKKIYIGEYIQQSDDEPFQWAECFPNSTNIDLIYLIKQTMQFIPHYRMTANEMTTHIAFNYLVY